MQACWELHPLCLCWLTLPCLLPSCSCCSRIKSNRYHPSLPPSLHPLISCHCPSSMCFPHSLFFPSQQALLGNPLLWAHILHNKDYSVLPCVSGSSEWVWGACVLCFFCFFLLFPNEGLLKLIFYHMSSNIFCKSTSCSIILPPQINALSWSN